MGCGPWRSRGWRGSIRGASLEREELRELSPAILRQRLEQLKVAPSDCADLGYRRLVDTVLLWNVLDRLEKGTKPQQAAALEVLRSKENRLCKEVLEKALSLSGVTKEEHEGLGKGAASKLLYRKLLRSTMTKGAAKVLARTSSALLHAALHEWLQAARRRDVTHAAVEQLAVVGEDIDAWIVGNANAASRGASRAVRAHAARAPAKRRVLEEVVPQGPRVASKWKTARDQKFDNMDGELADLLALRDYEERGVGIGMGLEVPFGAARVVVQRPP